MAKTNFSKVEEALNDGLRRMNISGLLDMAAVASETGGSQAQQEKNAAVQKQLIATLQFDVKHCKDEKLFEVGGFTRKELKTLLAHPQEISPEGWTALFAFRKKVDAYKKDLLAQSPSDANEKLVEAQRKRHINKRYNTKELWLPLH